jgi:hypothetical protein
MFEESVVGYWTNKENHRWCSQVSDSFRKFFDWLGSKLGFFNMDLWYSVTQEDICANGGNGIFSIYDCSISKALQAVYPEHKWDLARFKHKPANLWKKKDNERQAFFAYIVGEPLGNKTPPGFWDIQHNQRYIYSAITQTGSFLIGWG